MLWRRGSMSHSARSWRLVFGTLSAFGAFGCGGATSEDTSIRSPAFIAVGAQGTILSSANGRAWTKESSGASAYLASVAASRSLLVAVGADGTILTSAHGTTWTSCRSGTDVDLAHVIFNGEQFIAVGGAYADQAVALTSRDGTTWTRLEGPPHYSFHAVAFAGGTMFVSAETPSKEIPMALDNVVLAYVLPSTSSPAGWLDKHLPRFSDSLIVDDQTLTAGNWSGKASLSSSTDGETWTSQLLPGSEARAIASSG
jgi:hypothetical protein